MKLSLTGGGVVALALGVAAVGVGVYVYRKRAGIVAGAATVADWVNPTSRNNLAYTGVNAVGAAVTGRDYALGADIRDAAEGGIGPSNTGIGPLDFAVDTILYPVNAAVRAVKESARSTAVPEPYAETSYPTSPFTVGA